MDHATQVQDGGNLRWNDALSNGGLSSFSTSDEDDENSSDSEERVYCSPCTDSLDTSFFGLEQQDGISTLDPYVSRFFYYFCQSSYNSMKLALQGEHSPSLKELQACDPSGMLDLKRWRRMKERLCLRTDVEGFWCLCTATPPNLKISPIEEWESIIIRCHFSEDNNSHLSYEDTIRNLKAS
ncbi:hypothetical protein GOP47_0022990 [Adiantum capillus-veneris]|uniref:Uncharacterized protein n=1 Tax=Adiantum capillus-veneris TaxID=13818 RepID=A0A9D4U6H1_ADICA|nr:hypothetical protein GOP47_0022990 [Adiantum capillus-veneris]